MVKGEGREDVAVDLCGFVKAFWGCRGSEAKAFGKGQAYGLCDIGGIGRWQTHTEESAVYGADDALACVGKGAVKVEEDVFVVHKTLTLKRRKKCAADEKAFRMGRGEDVVMIMRRIWNLYGFSSSLF